MLPYNEEQTILKFLKVSFLFNKFLYIFVLVQTLVMRNETYNQLFYGHKPNFTS